MAYTTINKSSLNFNIKLYTGNGGTNAQTGVGFKPDFTWIKQRLSGGYNHALFDAVRGATKVLQSNANVVERTLSDSLTAFGSDGFTLGADGDGTYGNTVNQNTKSYCSWNWKAGGSNNGNTNGNITSTTSVNNTAGFSIITYTGSGSNATVGHGLSTAPKMIIVKRKDVGANWQVYNGNLAANQALELNGTGGNFTAANRWNSTAPTNTVFSVGNATEVNAQYGTYVAYCFADKTGYSKFGSYTGNGNANGTFVYTGFKPAWTLIKRTDSGTGGSWILFDNKRATNVRNPIDVVMAASNNQSESDWGDAFDCDYVSNGFKWRFNGTNGYNNTSGATYIYMAFGQSLVGTNNVPCTAR